MIIVQRSRLSGRPWPVESAQVPHRLDVRLTVSAKSVTYIASSFSDSRGDGGKAKSGTLLDSGSASNSRDGRYRMQRTGVA
jgi:hypothetical protein